MIEALQDIETSPPITDFWGRDTHRYGGPDAIRVDWDWWLNRFRAMINAPDYKPVVKRREKTPPREMPLFRYEEFNWWEDYI